MDIIDRKESKLLERIQLKVLFKEKSGVLARKDAVKAIAQEMNVDESSIGLISLKPEAGTRNLIGTFHIYNSEEKMKMIHHKHLSVRLMSKEEREALKQAKKKAEQPKVK
jgi:ribosomal protein S24E